MKPKRRLFVDLAVLSRCAGVCSCLIFLLFPACDLGNTPEPDPQFVQIHFKYGFGNVVNTFDGTLTKDLVLDGSITVPFWFTTAEQRLIIAELERAGFYDLPDTVRQVPGVSVEPNPGPQYLRVRTELAQKSVLWFFPPDQANGYGQAVEQVASAIRTIVEAKPEYRRLPPARGGYL